MSRVDELNRILRTLRSGTPGVEAAAILSGDGLVVAGALPPDLEEDRVAGIGSALVSLGTRAAAELGRGPLEQLLVRGPRGWVVAANAAPGTFLLVLTTAEARLGLVLLDLKRAAAEVAGLA